MNKTRIHLVGIAGVGMSALAQADQFVFGEVTGSDRFKDAGRELDVLRKLETAGIRLFPQDGSGITPETRRIIVSTAIEQNNPDLEQARKLGVPIRHRAQELSMLVGEHRCLAVAGTAGKTTVTGLLGWILDRIGCDPTVVNGGAVINWRSPTTIGNFRAGHSDLWVVETDESDRSLLNFTPDWAILTNISKDHFELDEVQNLFRQFARRVKQGIVCGRGVAAVLKSGAQSDSLPELVETDVVPRPARTGYEFVWENLKFEVPLCGYHNAENALLAVILCDRLGYDLASVQKALVEFRGIERRLERVGCERGIMVYDDYAHNPAKILAAWQAVRPASGHVVGVWRPHGFGPLAAMFEELASAFQQALQPGDRLFILPVFYAGGTAKPVVESEALVQRLHTAGLLAEWVKDYDALMERVTSVVAPGDAVLCMGARDPDLPQFGRALCARLKQSVERRI